MASNRKRGISLRPTLAKVPVTGNELTLLDGSSFDAEDYFDSLHGMSTEQLANQYASINSQSQMMKGLILLKAREQFPSNIEFGDWVNSVHALCVDGQQVRNRYMHLANFFKSRAMTGISITAAYQISKPDNDSVAVEVYEEVINKNLPVKDITRLIRQKKAITGAAFDKHHDSVVTPKSMSEKKGNDVRPIISPENAKTVMDMVDGLGLQTADAVALLEDCIEKLKLKKSFE